MFFGNFFCSYNIALHAAAWRGSLGALKYLALDTDADLKIKNKDGKKAVDVARHLEVKSFLQSFEGDEDDAGDDIQVGEGEES